MRVVSDAFLRTLTGAHRMVSRATVCGTYQSGVIPAGTVLDIVAGDVRIDGTAHIRSTLDLAVVADWPKLPEDVLMPTGNEVYCERGIAYNDSLVEWVGLGYFRIDRTQMDNAGPTGLIRLSGSDRMAGLIDARLTKPRQFAAGTTLGDIFETLVLEVYPQAVIVWDDTTDADTIGRATICEEDRHDFLDNLVKSRGKVWYWDHAGQLSIKTPPDSSTPAWSAEAGTGGTLLSLSRTLDRTGVYNAVIARGEAPDEGQPTRGVAYDANPNSPTYYGGRFGKVPRFYQSPFLATSGQASAAAAAMLRRGLGVPYLADFTAVPNPALEPFDPVAVRARDEGARTFLIETLTVPLSAGGVLRATTRDQTTVQIGTEA